jgi:hypothetical protein
MAHAIGTHIILGKKLLAMAPLLSITCVAVGLA